MRKLRARKSIDLPLVSIDTDLKGPILAHNELKIGGWAAADGGIASVKVRIGTHEFEADCDLSSDDMSRSRFELKLDSSDWDSGEYLLVITATDAQGRSDSVAGSIDVLPYRSPPLGEEAALEAIAAGAPAMWYESPDLDGGTVFEEAPEIRGWATSSDGIERVTVTVDEALRLPAIHGLARPDLRAGFGEEVAGDCGFVLRLDPAELPPGRHMLTIVAETTGGERIGVAGTVEHVGRTSAGEPPADDATGEDHLGSGERFVPEVHRGTSLEPEHHVRYRWAAELVEGRRVLDAGCGIGWGTALLAAQAAETTGIDISPLAIGEARRRYGDVALFREGDLNQLPFADGTFDAVVSFEAIEHVADPQVALDEMQRVLRRDGLLLVSSPNKGVYPAGNPFHLHELTSDEFSESLQRRFANVRVHRQQTYVASLLGTSETLELDDPSQPLTATTTKMVGGAPGSELYSVAVASDGELPPTANHLALGGELDREEHRRMLEPWQDRATRAEVELARTRAAAHRAARELQGQLARSRSALVQVQGSRSWRVTEPLRSLKRLLGR